MTWIILLGLAVTYLNRSLISLPDSSTALLSWLVHFPDTNTPTEPHPMELTQIGSVLSVDIKSNLKQYLKSTAERSSLWKFFSRICSNEAPSFDGLAKYFRFIKRSVLRPAYFSSSLCHISKKGWHTKRGF